MIIVQTNKEAATPDYLGSFALGFGSEKMHSPLAPPAGHISCHDPDLTTLFKDELPTIIFMLKLMRK